MQSLELRRRPLLRATLVLAVAAIPALAMPPAASTQAAPAPKVVTATASIRGRVLTTGGQPIRGAQVQARAARDTRVVSTGADGTYEIRDLLPGSWTIQASKAGYVSLQHGQLHPYAPAVRTPVADGERVVADLTLMRGGAIAGQVVDAHGEPVMGALVLVMRAQMVRGRRQLTPLQTTPDTTDDTGAFRLHGLVPGEYYVVADVPSHTSSPDMRTAGVRVLYPGTRSAADALPITVGRAQEQLGILIATPPPVRGVRVSGTVIDSQGAPAATAAIHVYSPGEQLMPMGSRAATAVTGPDGRFMLSDVSPGSYTLDATLTIRGPENLERAAIPLDVGGSDVEGVTLVMRRAATLRATVETFTGEALPGTFSIRLSADGDGPYGTFSRRVQSAGRSTSSRQALSIEMPGLHAPSRLVVSDLPAGWLLEAIELGGQDVTDAEIDFGAFDGAVHARIVVSDRSASVVGRVTQRGEPAPGRVIVFPENSTRWGYPSRFVRTATAGMDGRFEIRDLPPGGPYRAVAIDFALEGEHEDPAFLADLRDAGTPLSAVAQQTVTLELERLER